MLIFSFLTEVASEEIKTGGLVRPKLATLLLRPDIESLTNKLVEIIMLKRYFYNVKR